MSDVESELPPSAAGTDHYDPDHYGPERYSTANFNHTFIDNLIAGGMGVLDSEGVHLIDHALTALFNNYNGTMHTQFHAFQGVFSGGHTSSSISEWMNKRAISDIVHHFSPPIVAATATAKSDFDQLVHSGVVLQAFAYERKKHFIIQPISQWLALTAVVSLYVWMTSPTGCHQFAQHLFEEISACNLLRGGHCSCNSNLRPFVALGHHVMQYFDTPRVDQTSSVPPSVLAPIVSNFKLDSLSTIWMDIRPKPPPAQPTRRNRREAQFITLFQLILEQIFVYPRAKSALLATAPPVRTNSRAKATGSTRRAVNTSLKDIERILNLAALRNHILSVGGICSALQSIFGTTIIFSFACNGAWQSLIENPASFLFLDTKAGTDHGISTLASSFIKDATLTMGGVCSYINSKLREPISSEERDLDCRRCDESTEVSDPLLPLILLVNIRFLSA